MRAYKFFHPGAVGPFTGFPWPPPEVAGAPGPWVEPGGAQPCVRGVHACRVEDLPYWAAEELWVVELGGEVVRTGRKLVASKGRLLTRVDEWSEGGRARFGAACARQARDVAAQRARRAGAETDAEDLMAAGSLVDLRDRAGRVARSLEGIDAVVVAYASDAAGYALAGEPCIAGLIAAVQAADAEAGAVTHDLDAPAFRRERRRQAAWLADHFGFTDTAS